MPETAIGIFFAVAQTLEYHRLHVAAVNSDASARQFIAITHQVIGVAQHRAGIRLEAVEMFFSRHGKRVVREAPALRLLVPLEHGKVDDPGKSQKIRRREGKTIAKPEPQVSQGFERNGIRS